MKNMNKSYAMRQRIARLELYSLLNLKREINAGRISKSESLNTYVYLDVCFINSRSDPMIDSNDFVDSRFWLRILRLV